MGQAKFGVHGTEGGYKRGCRCVPCREAARTAKKARREKSRVPCSHGCGTMVDGINRRDPDKPPECRPCALSRIHGSPRKAEERKPVKERIPSLLPSRELLTSQYDGTHHHAIYPTGTTTLCGLDGEPDTRRDAPPDCPTCKTVAEAWHRIDKACPEHWLTYTVAPVEKDAA